MTRSTRSVTVTRLGQSGFKLDLDGFVVLTDPYLSDSVARIEGPEFARLQPPPVQASSIHDAALVLISHAHRDHCDPDTLLPIAAAATTCRFMGPPEVLRTLRACGLDPQRVIAASAQPQLFGPGISITAVPAAHKHVEIESDGSWRFVGYVIEHDDRRYYFAGDTCVHDAVLGVLAGIGRIDVAFLPVNECNFYRDRRGIVGNMSVRDAFQMARELDVKAVVPMHYDMFAPNCVYREEIELIYSRMQPGFELVIEPERL